MEFTNNMLKILDLMKKYKKIFLKSEDDNEIIDIGGEVVELLNSTVKYINEEIIGGTLIKTQNICDVKNELTLFKEYFINYIDGLLNRNEYIINKYRKYVEISFDICLEDMEEAFLLNLNK